MAIGAAEDLIAEVTDFLADSPSADQQIELNEFMFMNHFLILLKAKAQANYRPPLNFPVFDLGPWPEGFEVRREEIYGDDGR